jgi:hypothetical protein
MDCLQESFFIVKLIVNITGSFTDAHDFLPVFGALGQDIFQGTVVIG